MPPAQWSEQELQGADVVAPISQTVIRVAGNASEPAHDLHFEGFNITHAAISFLEPYEAPSGGDWSVHRGAAFFAEDAERISMRQLQFDQVDGNAVFFSDLVRNSSVEDCDFWRIGESALLTVGSVPAGGDARDASRGKLPMNNSFIGNWIEEVGVHIKQTSCFFKSAAGGNLVQGNVCYNGPRAGFNSNDGLPGGDVFEQNVIFNMVRESGDHGTFNSWDRKEFIYDCVDGTGTCFTPRTIRLRHNMFIGPAGWNVDHDDGSSQFEDFSNVVFLGNFKYRDGVMRNMTRNLLVDAGPSFQVIGFDTDFFVDNTIASAKVWKYQVCGPDIATITGTTYALITDGGAVDEPNGSSGIVASTPCTKRGPGWRPPHCQCDGYKGDHSNQISVNSQKLQEMLRATVGATIADEFLVV
jgi:hypothetical protein